MNLSVTQMQKSAEKQNCKSQNCINPPHTPHSQVVRTHYTYFMFKISI